MQVFLNFIAENQSAQNLLNSVARNQGHQGSVIRFSDRFLEISAMIEYDPDFLERFIYDYYEFGFRYGMPLPPKNVVSKISYSDIHDYKERLYGIIGKPASTRYRFHRPFEVVICIYNDADSKPFEETAKEFMGNDEYNVVIERRSRNELLSGSRDFHETIKGGISIGKASGNYGTLGGILRDAEQNVYGLTCSHVMENRNEKAYQPSLKDSEEAREIGDVELISNFIWSDAKSVCNPRIDSRQINTMDAALIKLSADLSYDFEVHNLGEIVGIKPFNDIMQNMEVEFNGRTTNMRKKLIVGGICVSYKSSFEKKSACFTNLIELREPYSTQFFGYNIQNTPIQKGDSGSWICSNDQNGYNWCGMLISGDVDRGYFIAAEDINKWLIDNKYDILPNA